MLASGIMEPIGEAAEKIANMALAMLIKIKKIDSPLKNDKIKVKCL